MLPPASLAERTALAAWATYAAALIRGALIRSPDAPFSAIYALSACWLLLLHLKAILAHAMAAHRRAIRARRATAALLRADRPIAIALGAGSWRHAALPARRHLK